MEVIDAQLHAWEHDSREYPWDQEWVQSLPEHTRRRFECPVTTENLVHMMLAVGVDAAIMTSPSLYGSDHSYAFAAAKRYPEKFGVVGPVKASDRGAEAQVAQFRERPGGLGVRLVVIPGMTEALGDPGPERVFATAERAEVPVFLVGVGFMEDLPGVARSHPNLQIIIDHLGGSPLEDKDARIARLPELLRLASFDNVAVKCTEATGLSSEPYPFMDIWPQLHAVIDAFGAERVMWGTDITVHRGELFYAEAVDYMRRTNQLSDDEKALVLGRTLRRVLRWTPPSGSQAE